MLQSNLELGIVLVSAAAFAALVVLRSDRLEGAHGAATATIVLCIGAGVALSGQASTSYDPSGEFEAVGFAPVAIGAVVGLIAGGVLHLMAGPKK